MFPDYTRAARMAYKTLLALKLDSFPINPLLILSHCRNTTVHTYAEIAPRFGISDPFHFRWYVMENREALTIRQDGETGPRFEMLYDSQTAPARRRFTLAHELGHIVLKHRQEAPYEEKEADYYASQLLAPRPVFDLFAAYSLPIDDPEFISATFGLSQAASEMALKTPKHFADDELYSLIRDQFEPYCEGMSLCQSQKSNA